MEDTKGAPGPAGGSGYAVNQVEDVKAFKNAGLMNGMDHVEDTLPYIRIKMDLEKQETILAGSLKDAGAMDAALNKRKVDGVATSDATRDVLATRDINPADATQGGVTHNV